MSELKCPFCGEEIKIAGERTTIMSCFNGDCVGSGLYGEEAMWQALIESYKSLVLSEQSADREIHRLRDLLSQSQKDLEIARKVLEKIISDYEVGASSGWLAANAKQALEQIDHIAGASKMVEPKE